MGERRNGEQPSSPTPLVPETPSTHRPRTGGSTAGGSWRVFGFGRENLSLTPPRVEHSPQRTLIKRRVPLGLMAAETCLTLGLGVLLVLYFFFSI